MLELHMIPTSGDATLLSFKESSVEVNILIDGGNRKNDCISYLQAVSVDKLNLVIASHLDEDHIRGLRRITDELNVDELWITDVNKFVRPAADSIYFMKCIYENYLVVDGSKLRHGNKKAVYDGYKCQIGPFFIEVLSPPKSLHNYLSQSDVVKRILNSRKGQTIRRYVKDAIEKRLRDFESPNERQREDVKAEIIDRFNVDIPQIDEIADRIENDDIEWRQHDNFYDSARSLFNDISIVVKITFDYKGVSKTFLFPGDLTNWSLMMSDHHDEIINCITKIPHHGSDIYSNSHEVATHLSGELVSLDFWDKVAHPSMRFIWRDWKFCIEEFGAPFFMWPWDHGKLPSMLSHDLDSQGVYQHLSPPISFIYPLRSSYCLPRLDVRNAIKANSKKTLCNYIQGKATTSTMEPEKSCIDCFNCTEKRTPTILNWP